MLLNSSKLCSNIDMTKAIHKTNPKYQMVYKPMYLIPYKETYLILPQAERILNRQDGLNLFNPINLKVSWLILLFNTVKHKIQD